METLGLTQLQRRVREAALQRLKTDFGESNQALESSVPLALAALPAGKHKFLPRSQIFGSGGRHQRGGVRKLYQELLQTQQMTEISSNEYASAREAMKAAQRQRLLSLERCHQLTEQLIHPLSLDEAMPRTGVDSSIEEAVSEKLKGWCSDVPRQGLDEAVKCHLHTADVMESITSKAAENDENSREGMDGNRKRYKWSVVAAPHDVTGPPIDLCTLPSVQYETLLGTLTDSHFSSKQDKVHGIFIVKIKLKAH